MPVLFPPLETIETPDLRLREITLDDSEAYFALCSDPSVMRTFGLPVHGDKSHTEKLIRQLQVSLKEEKMIRWGIIRKDDGKFIGDVGFWRFVKERSRAEVGAKLAKAFWSGGLMTQALAAVVDYGFNRMDLNTVEANVDPLNPGAVRLVEKVGFLHEGTLREHSWDIEKSKFADTLLYTAHRSRWKLPW